MSVSAETVPPANAPRINRWLAGGLACACGFYVFYFNVLSGLNHDELEAVHTAWKVLRGERIYVDFVQHHHPLFYAYLAPVIALCGERAATVIACRMAVLPFLLGIVGATWLLARRQFDKRTALVAAACLLSSWPFLYVATQIRPDVPEVALGMFGLLALLPGDAGRPGSPTRGQCLLSGLCVGLSFLFLQKGVFYVAAATLVLLARIFRRESGWRELAAFWAGLAIAVAPLGIWVAFHHTFQDYFFWNWTVNASFRDRFSFAPYATVVLKTQPGICGFALLGFSALLVQKRRWELTVVLAALSGTVLFARSPYPQYWMPLLPLLAIYAAHGMVRALGGRPAILAAVLAANAAAPAVVEWLFIRDATNLGQLDQIAYVLKTAGPADPVYDGYAAFNVFRKDVDYFWFSLGDNDLLGTYRQLRDYDLDIYDRIDAVKPKVVSTYRIEDLQDARIRDHYVKSDTYPELLIRIK